MSGSWAPEEFPNLTTGSYIETSPATSRYNCLAWAVGNATQWWWPDALDIYYWPRGVARSNTLESFIAAYESLTMFDVMMVL